MIQQTYTPEQMQVKLWGMQTSLTQLQQAIIQDKTIESQEPCIQIMKELIQSMQQIKTNEALKHVEREMKEKNAISKHSIDTILSSFINLKLDYTQSSVENKTATIQAQYTNLLNQKSTLDKFLQTIPQAAQTVWTPLNTPTPSQKPESWGSKLLKIVGWVAIGTGIIRWAKKIWWRITGKKKEEKEEKEENEGKDANQEKQKEDDKWGMSWRKKWLLALWWWLAWRWIIKNWDKIKEAFWFKKWPTFEESITQTNASINILPASEQWLKTWFDGVQFDPNTSEIVSFGQRTKIDKKKKTIPWLSAEFGDYAQMIFTASLINTIKRNYKGKWTSMQPFTIDWWGDLMMTIKDGGKERQQKIISGGMWSTLAKHVPDIDWWFFKKAFSLFGGNNEGKQKLANYLNTIPLWQASDAPLDTSPDLPTGPEIQKEIEDTDKEKTHGATRWTITIRKIDEKNYEVISRDTSTKLEKSDTWMFVIQWLDIFLPEKEAWILANYINKMKKEYAKQWYTKTPFSHEYEWMHGGIWFQPKESTNTMSSKIRTLTNTNFKARMPTIYKNQKNIDMLITYLNALQNEKNESYWY
jgi:hypothetical protein